MQRPSDQIGGKELRKRVAVAIHAELIDRLQDGNLEDWPTVAAMAQTIRDRFDDDSRDAIYFRGLKRISRKVLRLAERDWNRRRQRAASQAAAGDKEEE